MRRRLEIAICPFDDRDDLDGIEGGLVRELDPPFNLDKTPHTPMRRRLSKLRQAIRARRKEF